MKKKHPEKKPTPEIPHILTASQAEKLRLANILIRQKKGRKISTSEQAFVDEQTGAAKPDESTQEKTYSWNGLAELTGHTRGTVKRYLRKVPPTRTVKGRGEWTLAQLEIELSKGRLSDELKEERLRGERLDNERKEMENSISRKELVRMDEVLAMLTDVLLPVRQRFLALPAELSSLANPTDPQFAFAAATRWSEQAMKSISEKLGSERIGKSGEEVKVPIAS